MNIFGTIQNFFSAKSPEEEALAKAHEEELRKKIVARCSQLRRLLDRNKKALELMSDIEMHLQKHDNIGSDYIGITSKKALRAVADMVDCLNALSADSYKDLSVALLAIEQKIDDALETDSGQTQKDISVCPYIMPLADIRLEHIHGVGGKMANLGEIQANVGLAVPDGFAVTVNAYEHFMNFSNLFAKIEEKIQQQDFTNLDEAMRICQDIQNSILASPLPPDLESVISEATQSLLDRVGDDTLLALRSSALGEDSKNMSFAGQYRSELNVPPEEVCHVWKEIIASTYSLSAMTYRFQKGVSGVSSAMCVGVLAMVKARCGGVAYSRNPLAVKDAKDCVVINAVAGLAQGVVDGSAIPDVFYLSHTPKPILLGEQHGGDTPSGLSCEMACRIAKIAIALEGYYTEPQDVEWSLDEKGEIIILQSRPLKLVNVDSAEVPEQRCADEFDAQLDGLTVLAKGGIPASPGVGIGVPCILRKEADMFSFPHGGIMVVERAFPRWATLLPRAAGLISETGGAAGHLASVAREYKIPALFGLKNACTLLHGVDAITLDVGRSCVFLGRHEELLPVENDQEQSVGAEYVLLEKVASLITPLHLLDPQSPEFSPKNCLSLHDVTRFCHEKAVALLFDMQDTRGKKIGKQLKAGAKLQYWIVDMGHAFTHPVPGSVVDIKEIASLPMLALWQGLVAIPWMGPPSAGAAGFMSVVLESTMNPELESTAPTSMQERNFFILDRDYLLLQARYGYHFCTVESRVCEHRSENFVTFQFKGGAADRSRRMLRVQMLALLLEEFQFRVDVREDALSAVAEGFSKENTLRRVSLLGYLLIHSRQSDTIMLDPNRSSAFRSKLASDMQTVFQKDLAFLQQVE